MKVELRRSILDELQVSEGIFWEDVKDRIVVVQAKDEGLKKQAEHRQEDFETQDDYLLFCLYFVEILGSSSLFEKVQEA